MFSSFPKIPRLYKPVIVTEKIDGTNGQIKIVKFQDVPKEEWGRCVAKDLDNELAMFCGSRNRLLHLGADNYGLFRWVADHNEELFELGEGTHFGEWWGSGIQRGYGRKNGDKTFSLFNVSRWRNETENWSISDGAPECCSVVPVVATGNIATAPQQALALLRNEGSIAASGYMNPEGVVVFHTGGSNAMFKAFVNPED